MDAHEINEQFRLLTHQAYLECIEGDPSLIERATAWVEETIKHGEPTLGERMWFVLLSMPLDDIKRAMMHPGPEGRLLRSNSPFSDLIGVKDFEARSDLWRQAQSAF